MKTKCEVIAEILGCKSTDVVVIETPESITYQTKVAVTDEQHAEIVRYLNTGVHLSLWSQPTKLRIIAPISLADEKPELLLFLYKLEKLKNLVTENDGKNIIIYCNLIEDSDIPLIQMLSSTNLITIEGVDENANQYLNTIGL